MRSAAWIRSGRVPGAAATVLVTLAAIALAPARAAAIEQLEYRVKAEFIERFTHFVEWPPAAFPAADTPFAVCVLGESPVTGYLDEMAHSRRIKGRRVELRRLGDGADPSRCHVLFIGPDERGHLRQVLGAVAGRPVLTVADTEGFGRAGVLINLVIDEEGRVRFDISSRVARTSALMLKAQLLKLSRHLPEND